MVKVTFLDNDVVHYSIAVQSSALLCLLLRKFYAIILVELYCCIDLFHFNSHQKMRVIYHFQLRIICKTYLMSYNHDKSYGKL